MALRSSLYVLTLLAVVGCGPRLPGLPTGVDPVCGREIPQVDAAAVRHYGDDTFYFDSQACALTFDGAPQEYSRHAATARPGTDDAWEMSPRRRDR
ncbi:MAG TPA: hypothetical protein VNM14_23705 [Planctomycetota bacterium]|nr:hypothetical protein [Planctomycetota bacterium]